MSDFNGYLLRVRDVNGSWQEISHHYIKLDSWKCTPKQREEIKAYRDDNTRALTRETASGTKSTFTFTTLKLHLAEKQEILSLLINNSSNTLERKVHLQYWDDENSRYDEGDFYWSDVEYTIYRITANDIIYNEITFTFVEY